MAENLIEQLAAIDVDEQAASMTRYRELLSRADKPEKADVKELRQCMLVLGKDVQAVNQDLAALSQAKTLETKIRPQDDLDAAVSAAGDAQRAFWADEERRKKELEAESFAVSNAYRLCKKKHRTIAMP